jgi:integrase/recombinase XerD
VFISGLNSFSHKPINRGEKNNTIKPAALSTIHMNLVAVLSLLNYLYINRMIDINPSLLIKLPVKQQSLPRHILSEGQIQRLLAKTGGSVPLNIRNRAILELLYASGIRNSELRHLKLSDIDLDQLQLMVHKGKNQKDRLIPIGEVAAHWLERYRDYW